MTGLVIREVTMEDRIALWEWRNDSVLGTIFKADPSVTYIQHRSWFDKIRKSKQSLFYVGVIETLRIGCVRFDETAAGHYELLVFVKPIYCGKGHSAPLIDGAIAALRKGTPVKKISANILNVNAASSALFRGLGFSTTEVNERLYCERKF